MTASPNLAIALFIVIALASAFESHNFRIVTPDVSSSEECDENEEWLDTEHAVLCNSYCYDGGMPTCTRITPIAGCFCKSGYALNRFENCIKRQYCTAEDSHFIIALNNIIEEASEKLAIKINSLEKNIETLYARLVKVASCIPATESSNCNNIVNQHTPAVMVTQCGPNEEWLDTKRAIACEGYCFDGGHPLCYKMEPTAGCYCKRGYIRNKAAKCIIRENCTPADVRNKIKLKRPRKK